MGAPKPSMASRPTPPNTSSFDTRTEKAVPDGTDDQKEGIQFFQVQYESVSDEVVADANHPEISRCSYGARRRNTSSSPRKVDSSQHWRPTFYTKQLSRAPLWSSRASGYPPRFSDSLTKPQLAISGYTFSDQSTTVVYSTKGRWRIRL
jgi:hypothetical protein